MRACGKCLEGFSVRNNLRILWATCVKDNLELLVWLYAALDNILRVLPEIKRPNAISNLIQLMRETSHMSGANPLLCGLAPQNHAEYFPDLIRIMSAGEKTMAWMLVRLGKLIKSTASERDELMTVLNVMLTSNDETLRLYAQLTRASLTTDKNLGGVAGASILGEILEEVLDGIGHA